MAGKTIEITDTIGPMVYMYYWVGVILILSKLSKIINNNKLYHYYLNWTRLIIVVWNFSMA